MMPSPTKADDSSLDAPASPVRVLVVDDSRAQRRILTMQLERWGYLVTEAESGEAALEFCRSEKFDIVLSDWVMTGMTGLEFCQAFRALPHESYGYFILLTSKSEKAEVADGLENGADDFLSKPVNSDELRARLRAGQRIVSMQNELIFKNQLVSTTLGQIQKLYDSLDRDLIEARKLQQSLVRDRYIDFGLGKAWLMIQPSGHVGGDLAGSFIIDERRIALFSVDVSGHGVASAMMTARLAGLLSSGAPDQNIALTLTSEGARDAFPPDEVATRLNRMMLEDVQVEQYFTLAYAEIDLISGELHLVQAGHPHPLILRRTGAVDRLGNGGMPIGLIPGADYQTVSSVLLPGDRLFLVSDGVTECPGPTGDLGEEGLAKILRGSAGLQGNELLESLMWDLSDHTGGQDFPDDVSCLLFEYTGPV
ncbi:SpoIIE family protein phosphatase [Rhodobacteraceae bacterium CYK-10]|uniref:SpoIIE family protein phosphatase n=2 Tax=Stagnihabitans tardus TaxID=2699202 RepID=A0AAE4YAM3_9RHOB|nr:SpoIIE family protein phosphatase [Stagnihabitans tardus]